MKIYNVFIVLSAALLFLATEAYPQSAERGKMGYESLCISCHGRTGSGDGPGARVLGVPVGDLSNRAYMSLLSDQDLYERIAYGGEKFPYIQMPGWQSQLSVDSIKDIVAYVRTLEVDRGPLKGPTPKERMEKFNTSLFERGRVYYTRFCSHCHGKSGDGKGWTAEKMVAKPIDFTDPAKMAGKIDQKIINYVRGRKEKAGPRYMPSFELLREDMLDGIIVYIKGFSHRRAR